MNWVALTAFLTIFFSIGVKVVGMPDQIKSNFRRKSVDGLSTWFIISTLISYALWVIYGLQKHDLALVIGQGLGVVVTAVIVFQMFLYRSNRSKTKSQQKKRPLLLWYSLQLMKHQDAAASDSERLSD